MRLLAFLLLAVATLAGCSFASIDECPNPDNVFGASVGSRAVPAECVYARAIPNGTGGLILGVQTSYDQFDFDRTGTLGPRENEGMNLTIFGAETGQTYALDGRIDLDFGDPIPEAAAVLTYFTPEGLEAFADGGSVTLTSITESSASGTFTTTFNGDSESTGTFTVSL